MSDATFIDLMPELRECARNNPRFKVTEDGAITVNEKHYQWSEEGEVALGDKPTDGF